MKALILGGPHAGHVVDILDSNMGCVRMIYRGNSDYSLRPMPPPGSIQRDFFQEVEYELFDFRTVRDRVFFARPLDMSPDESIREIHRLAIKGAQS